MRRPVDADRLRRFMQALGPEADKDVRLYFTGGATAILYGWRTSTVDIDLKLEPDSDRVLRALPRLKESLEVNGVAQKLSRRQALFRCRLERVLCVT